MVAARPTGTGLLTRRVRVRTDQVAFVRYVLEAEDGVGLLHGDGTGELTMIAPHGQGAALDRLITDLAAEGLLELAEPALTR